MYYNIQLKTSRLKRLPLTRKTNAVLSFCNMPSPWSTSYFRRARCKKKRTSSYWPKASKHRNASSLLILRAQKVETRFQTRNPNRIRSPPKNAYTKRLDTDKCSPLSFSAQSPKSLHNSGAHTHSLTLENLCLHLFPRLATARDTSIANTLRRSSQVGHRT